jgi:hypothetical protein
MANTRNLLIVYLLLSLLMARANPASGRLLTKPRPLTIFMCTGIISDELGQPMPGASVQLSKKRMDTGAWVLKTSVTTGADGNYTVTCQADGPEDLLSPPEFRVLVTSGPVHVVQLYEGWRMNIHQNHSLDPTQAWHVASLGSAAAAVDYMNGNTANHRPCVQVKVNAVPYGEVTRFMVFCRWGAAGAPSPGWSTQTFTTDAQVLDRLNGRQNHPNAVGDAMLTAIWRGEARFHVFFRDTHPGPLDDWTHFSNRDQNILLRYVNGDLVSRPRLEPGGRFALCALNPPSGRMFHLFKKKAEPGQPVNLWKIKRAVGDNDVLDVLNGPAGLPDPILDAKRVSSFPFRGVEEYWLFVPTGLLVVTRPLFENAFGEYADFKYARGLETTVVTADWISNHIPGTDLRDRIRNCLRRYHDERGVRFAMLVGDSKDLPLGAFPPPATLSETWNLPAGYYIRTGDSSPNYTTLYWADLTDKVEYSGSGKDNDWHGEYGIAVGVVPVRSLSELGRVLNKSRNYVPARESHFIGSFDFVDDGARSVVQSLEDFVAHEFSEYYREHTLEYTQFEAGTSQSAAEHAVFEQPGILYSLNHGNFYEIMVGGAHVAAVQAGRFSYTNPAFIFSSCGVYAFMYVKCLVEWFLQAQKGPAASAQISISAANTTFWKKLYQGYTIGEAFYADFSSLGLNPFHLFGDPSLVMVDVQYGGPP